MNCPHCNSPVPPGASVCPNCNQMLAHGGAGPLVAVPTTDTGMSAGQAFGLRFVASLIDGVLLGVVSNIIAAILGLGGAAAIRTGDPSAAAGAGLAAAGGSIGLSLVLTALYAGFFLPKFGQTPGKMALGLRVINASGNNPSVGQAILRDVIGKWVSTLVCFLGYLWMLWDPKQQAWHDKIAGTFVVKK